MQPILEIKNISKKFRIRHEQQPYLSLRDSITSVFKNPFHQPSTINHQPSSEAFWALKDVSFDVFPGESIGIIGKNGAGKSTLLKILSKITPPSEGKIISRGRIASLLEVGTGFHSELTGRENIFLNGSILGMKRKEILAKFDEIVDFSGVEKFLDTPLKHYSSGMQLRLAFSVAAFLEPEILLIDEVLAVGDAEFQRKCLGKMDEVSKSGRTVLFVSHQLGAVSQLCRKSMLIDNGVLILHTHTHEVINYYLNKKRDYTNKYIANPGNTVDKELYFLEIFTKKEDGNETTEFSFTEPIFVQMKIVSNKIINDEIISFALLDKYGKRVFTAHQKLKSFIATNSQYIITISLPKMLIAPNHYSFHFALCKPYGEIIYDIHEGVCSISIIDTGTDFSMYEGKEYGNIIADCDWK